MGRPLGFVAAGRLAFTGSLHSLIERLVKAGLSPDAATADDGRTALHLAAGEGKLRVASKLVELGADVQFADRQGRNALEIARAAGYYDLEARLRLLSES